MNRFAVHWGNRLEDLAGALFDGLYGGAWPDPLAPRCIVVNSAVMRAWLRHYFVYEWPGGRGRVLANCDFQLLYPFVNNWMDRLLAPASAESFRRREPRHHPYALACLRWRIYRMLADGLAKDAEFAPVKSYLDEDPGPDRCFRLAGRLARIFDDYQVYRCGTLEDWEHGREDPEDRWQAALWRRLARGNPDSYAALFRGMRSPPDAAALKGRFGGAYRRVAVFGTTAMPAPYAAFLQAVLARVAGVDVYVLNPSEADWLDDVDRRGVDRRRVELMLEDHPMKDDPLMLPEEGHPLLCGLGRNLQEHLHLLESQTGGVSDTRFVGAGNDTLLHDLQDRMLNRVAADTVVPRAADDSIRIHICHGPRREIEVLHDHLLKWFTREGLEPRQVQVLVTDMRVYAPLIDAVFAAAALIPHAIEGRESGGDGALAQSFRVLLGIASSRFAATEILDLLRGEAVMAAFGLDDDAMEALESMVAAGGIRWGLDAAHRQSCAAVAMDPRTTWEYGLDRLLAGYAYGSPEPACAPWPVDRAEGGDAVALGRLACFIDRLRGLRARLAGERTLPEWRAELAAILDTFFAPTDTTYREIARIRRVIDDLPLLARAAAIERAAIPFAVVAAHLEGALAEDAPGDSLTPNAVVFCRLRPMNSRPAEIVAVLGLNGGAFPRDDDRPTFDLLARTRRRGDRSIRRDDRQAFLEAVVNARRRLHLSFTGRSDGNNEVLPPSIVLQELRDYLARANALKAAAAEDGESLFPFEARHRLQAAHPDYFRGGEKLFSYSRAGLMAARRIADGGAAGALRPAAARPGTPAGVRPALAAGLDEFTAFFENPARYYYRNALGVNLAPEGPAAGADEEPFETDALENYKLTGELLEILSAAPPTASGPCLAKIAGRLQADGRLPLGSAGLETIETVFDNLLAWLNARPQGLPGTPATLRTLLEWNRAAMPLSGNLTLAAAAGTVALTGERRIFEREGCRLRIETRPAQISAKDLIRAWIAHLFMCALPAGEIHTVVVGRRRREIDARCYRPLERARAAGILRGLADLFLRGRETPLEFAPDSALQFCLDYRDRGDGDAALRVAAAHWGSREETAAWSQECRDAWLYHAFGEDGPMSAARAGLFAANARAVFDALLDAAAEDVRARPRRDAERKGDTCVAPDEDVRAHPRRDAERKGDTCVAPDKDVRARPRRDANQS